MKERIERLIEAQKSKPKSKKNYDSVELNYLSEKAKYHSFIRYPLSLWVPGAVSLLIAIAFNYFLYYETSRENRSYSSIILTISLYYLSFILFYNAQIEVFEIDKKSGRVFLRYYNIYCSKNEKSQKIEDVIDIEIVLKGIQKGQNDTTKYNIRYRFNNNEVIEFGDTISFRKIAKKYQICCAITKGINIKDVDFSFVINESDVAPNFY